MTMLMSQLLHKEDEQILEEIRGSSINDLLKNKASDGTSFLIHIPRLYRILFNESCSSCPSLFPSYIKRLQTTKNTLKMATNKKTKSEEFTLPKGRVLLFAGTSRSYSDHNLTEEVAIEYLAKNKNRISMFKTAPENWEKLVDKYIKNIEKDKLDAKELSEKGKKPVIQLEPAEPAAPEVAAEEVVPAEVSTTVEEVEATAEPAEPAAPEVAAEEVVPAKKK